jgi:hypothetical protein
MAKKDIFKRELKRMRDWADEHGGKFPPMTIGILGFKFTVELIGYNLIATPENDPEMKLSSDTFEGILLKIVSNLK